MAGRGQTPRAVESAPPGDGFDHINSPCVRFLIALVLGLGWLELNGTSVGDAGLAHLVGHSKLVFLHLDRTNVTDAGLTHLSKMSGLQVLMLKNTDVSDAGLEHLKANSRLHTLVVSGTNVTDAGVLRLQQALPELKIVR